MYNTAIQLLKQIEEKGFDAYIVGGYPRDLYLKRPSVDIDICTNATPKDLKEIFGSIMLPTVNYGSVTIIKNKIRFEITTFRKDIKYENNRIPVKIKYIDSLSDDIKRRDFTINTICMDSDGTIIDLLNGRQDIDNKIIKMVGNPKIRLKEDSLRILRAVRFATVLDFKIDDELKKYIKKYSYLLKNLSYYRKKEELDKIFSSNNVEYGIELIKELNLAEPLELNNIDQITIIPSSVGIWAQLDVSDKYTFTNNEKDLIEKIKELENKNILDVDILYKYGLYLLTLVGEIKCIDRKLITIKHSELPIHSRLDINISAEEICNSLNKKPGEFLKHIYEDLEYKILHRKLNNDQQEIINYIINNYKK